MFSATQTSTSLMITQQTTIIATFFQDKVDVVRASTATTPSHDVRWHDTKTLSNWSIVTADEVAKLTGAVPCKTCSPDPIPTCLVKEIPGLLSPFISLLFQKSLSTGLFPTEFKEATVRPLLKKSGLDSTQKKNYRPVQIFLFCPNYSREEPRLG